MKRYRSSRARVTCALAGILGLVLVAACGTSGSSSAAAGAGSSTKKVVSLTLAGASGGLLPAYVAQKNGYFAQYGLDVTVKPVTNTTNVVAGLGHQFQFIETYPPSIISAAASGIDITAVAGGQVSTPTSPTLEVITAKGSPIKSWLQLQGKRVGTPSTSGIITTSLLAMIKRAGGNPSTVHLIQIPTINLKSQLDAGRVDAILDGTPYFGNLLAADYPTLGDATYDLAGAAENKAVLTTLIATSRAYATANKQQIANFVAALNKADAWIAANTTQAKKYDVALSGLSASLVASAALPTYQATISQDNVAPWVGFMKDAGVFNGTVDTTKLTFP